MSTITVVATPEPANNPPRIRLDVTDVGAPNLFEATITRLDPDGRVVPVRTFDGNPLVLSTSGLTRVGLVYDYEMPYGQLVQYSSVEDPTSTSGEVTATSERPWLVHPGVPELSRRIMIAAVTARVRKVARGVLYPMGRKSPVVQTDGTRKAPEYTLSLYTADDDERESLSSLLDDGSPLLLNIPATNPWGIPTEYLSIGDVAEGRTVRYLGEPTRVWEMPVTVVDRPSGGSQAERTWADVVADNATWADVVARYDTWLELLSGP